MVAIIQAVSKHQKHMQTIHLCNNPGLLDERFNYWINHFLIANAPDLDTQTTIETPDLVLESKVEQDNMKSKFFG